MRIVLPEEVSMKLYFYGFYERGLTLALLRYLTPGACFVDVGAHFGYYSVLAHRLVGSQGSVVAFEPTPSSYSVLAANLRGRPRARAEQLAVLSGPGIGQIRDFGIRLSAYNTMASGARLDADRVSDRLRASEVVEVRVVSLDEYLGDAGWTPNFIKIDVESSEIEVLKGMTWTLQHHRPVLSLEVGDLGVKGVPLSRACVDFLEARGYAAMRFDGRGFVPVRQQSSFGYDNLLFLPTELQQP